jgi:hypothetical protein
VTWLKELMYRSRRSFFGLTPEHKKYIYEELFALVYHCKFSYSDAYALTLFERRWFLKKTNTEVERINREQERAAKKK